MAKARDTETFEEMVMGLLDVGYTLHGGPFVQPAEGGSWLCQALVRKVEHCLICGEELKREQAETDLKKCDACSKPATGRIPAEL